MRVMGKLLCASSCNWSKRSCLALLATISAIWLLLAIIERDKLTRGDGAIGGATATQCCVESKSKCMPGNSEATCPSSPKPKTVRFNGWGTLLSRWLISLMAVNGLLWWVLRLTKGALAGRFSSKHFFTRFSFDCSSLTSTHLSSLSVIVTRSQGKGHFAKAGR